MKKSRATWFNVYERDDGSRSRDGTEYGTRKRAEQQAQSVSLFGRRKLLYRIRVRRYLEHKTP